MNTATRVAAAAATGYVLGRRRRLKMAIAVGSMLAGKRLATDPRGMLRQAGEFVESRPELAKLSDQVRTTLYTAARGAAVGAVSQRIDRLSDSIRDRSERLTGGVTEHVPVGRGSDEERGEAEPEERPRSRREERGEAEPEERPRSRREESQEEERGERRGPRRSRREDDSGPDDRSERPRKRTAKKAPAKRAASERGEAPARKRTAKKSASGRSSSDSKE
ncbi:hypothetical protein E1262_07875 [Jiangella aurantiaca]|uniref:DNA primase n=1 Tax=Jiangella aurantiaca TaxID=2530373 RepID=A0A4R5AJ75_9ACTN|nr:hypothetical protein [Jiangella aurantiaca]TDD71034.1 hypothetical protein E1262_07875 [Jiangella aurantiaca]